MMCDGANPPFEQRGSSWVCANKSPNKRTRKTSESDREVRGFVHVAGCGAWSASDTARGDSDGCDSGGYIAPNRMFGLKGDPVRVPLPKPARNEEAAQRLWEISEELTGVQWIPEIQTAPFAL